MKKNKKYTYITIISLIVSLLYILLIKTVDVKPIGPQNSEVGFSTLNNYVHTFLPYNNTWYDITKYLGIIPFLIVGFYCLIGLMQLIKRKSILKVDKKIILLGCFYIIVGLIYIFFEKVIINYRPVILEGELLEASFPSSHTLLAISICTSSLFINKYYIKNKQLLKGIDIFIILLMIILVIGRILSGVHWITDIIGGILISETILALYYDILLKIDEKEEK